MLVDETLVAEPEADARNIAILKFAGAIKDRSYQDFAASLQELFASGYSRLVVDLTDVTAISSAAAGCIIDALAKADERGGMLVFLRPSASVRAFFQLFELADSVTVAADLSNALLALDSGA